MNTIDKPIAAALQTSRLNRTYHEFDMENKESIQTTKLESDSNKSADYRLKTVLQDGNNNFKAFQENVRRVWS